MKKLFINSASTKSINPWKKANLQIPELHSQCWTTLICTRVTSAVCVLQEACLVIKPRQRRWGTLAAATLHIYKAAHKTGSIKSLTGLHTTWTHWKSLIQLPLSTKARGGNVIIRGIEQTACLKCPFASCLCVRRITARVDLFAFLSLFELRKRQKYGVFIAIVRHLFCWSYSFGHHSSVNSSGSDK